MTDPVDPLAQLQAHLRKERYAVFTNFLPPAVAWMAYRYSLMKVQNKQFIASDPQVPNTPAFYGDTLMEVLLESAVPAVERVVGEPVYPAYSYMRVYKKGDELKPHIDRPSCEISMTVCLGYNNAGAGDENYCWPICVDNAINYFGLPAKAAQPVAPGDGKDILLRPGDGLVYYGSEIRHWRNAFPGDHQAQLFLHFVRRNGPHAHLKFDGRGMLGAPHPSTQQQATPREQHAAAAPATPSNPQEPAPKPVPEGVLILPGFLTEAQTRYLIELSERGHAKAAETAEVKADGSVTQGKYTGFTATRIELTEVLPELRKICDPIFKEVIPKHYGMDIEWYEQPHMLCYEKGGGYQMHADSEQQDPKTLQWTRGVDRDISLLVYLNDDFEGGCLYFPALDYRLKPSRGMVVCFPSDHRYVHVAEPVVSGLRHVLISWAAARGTPRVFAKPPMRIVRL